jgi:hypothetical protein
VCQKDALIIAVTSVFLCLFSLGLLTDNGDGVSGSLRKFVDVSNVEARCFAGGTPSPVYGYIGIMKLERNSLQSIE